MRFFSGHITAPAETFTSGYVRETGTGYQPVSISIIPVHISTIDVTSFDRLRGLENFAFQEDALAGPALYICSAAWSRHGLKCTPHATNDSPSVSHGNR